MNRERIIQILTKEGYPDYMIESTATKVENFAPDIRDSFEQWLNDGVIPAISVQGHSISSLIEQFGMNPIGAFVTLDWLFRDPEKAQSALKRGIK